VKTGNRRRYNALSVIGKTSVFPFSNPKLLSIHWYIDTYISRAAAAAAAADAAAAS
jgi:hypothetical protein